MEENVYYFPPVGGAGEPARHRLSTPGMYAGPPPDQLQMDQLALPGPPPPSMLLQPPLPPMDLSEEQLVQEQLLMMIMMEEERSSLKQQLHACCLRTVDILCVWDCCWCWVRVQELFALLVFDPFMELFITLCIVVNTLFMAMDHDNMDADFNAVLRNGNFVSAVFLPLT